MTINWPPSPSVEDEETALAKEHSSKENVELRKADNQPAVVRGSVDQYPVIIDSDDSQTDTDSLKTVKPSCKTAKAYPLTSDLPSSRKRSEMPLTPPSSAEDVRACLKDFEPTDRATRSSASRSKSTTRVDEERPRSKSRPQVSRIRTDVNEIPRMNASARRAPSPYAYTKETGTIRIDPKSRYSGDNFLSPTHATTTPVSSSSVYKSDRSSEQQVKTEHHHDDNRQEARKIRFSDEFRALDNGQLVSKHASRDVSQRQTDVDSPSHSRPNPELLTPPGSRRQSKDTPSTPNTQERSSSHRVNEHSHHQGSRVTESPYASSAEESAKHRKSRDYRSSDSDERRPRRKSSRRRERPRFDEPFDQTHQRLRPYSDDEAPRRHRRETVMRSPLASPLVESPGGMGGEDYFARAFLENRKRTQSRGSRHMGDESAVLSPPTSPPRTPKSERNSQDYFSPISATIQRPAFRSREPSLEETQLKDIRAHSSLLSQATTGAAIAARTGPPLSRSATFGSENPPQSPSGKTSARKSSPTHEEEKSATRPDVRILREEGRSSRPPSMSQPSSRPSTRDGPTYYETSHHDQNNPPSRTSSYSGYESSPHSARPSLFGPSLTAVTGIATTLASSGQQESVLKRSKSFAAPQDIPPTSSEWRMPACPRSRPTTSHRDWYTFKEMSEIDVCPSCVDAVLTTRFRALLVRSLAKPYNEATVCAMSNPWIRVAFEQSVKHHKHDLKQVKDVGSTLPEEVRPCKGTASDYRKWWGIRDPISQKPIPDFYVCSACMMNVDTVFPDLKKAFERDTSEKERICHLHPKNKYFEGLIDHLEQASDRCHKSTFKPRYTESLVNHVRRISQSWGCCRDVPLKGRAWHFMPDLPEFTICEDCYKDVVWPLHDRFIARDISKVLKVPSARVAGKEGARCTLYSDRMRRIFQTAVNARDFELLRNRVQEREDARHRYQEINRILYEDLSYGHNRLPDIEKNRAFWRTIE